MKYFVLTIGNTGIRPGTESMAITCNCLGRDRISGIEHPVLVIRIPKGKQGARTMVPDRNVEYDLRQLRRFREEELSRLNKSFNEDEPIFCHEDGKPIHTFKKGFKTFLTHYGLLKNVDGEVRVPYSLRHTFATRHIEAGTNHWFLAKNMGTSVQELEDHYVHSDHKAYAADFVDSFEPIVTGKLPL